PPAPSVSWPVGASAAGRPSASSDGVANRYVPEPSWAAVSTFGPQVPSGTNRWSLSISRTVDGPAMATVVVSAGTGGTWPSGSTCTAKSCGSSRRRSNSSRLASSQPPHVTSEVTVTGDADALGTGTTPSAYVLCFGLSTTSAWPSSPTMYSVPSAVRAASRRASGA